jgi:hypothetical protein
MPTGCTFMPTSYIEVKVLNFYCVNNVNVHSHYGHIVANMFCSNKITHINNLGYKDMHQLLKHIALPHQ